MAKGIFRAELSSKAHKLTVSLELYKFREDNAYIMYCPALDLSTSGNSEEEAEKSFSETFQIYINYCLQKRTLVEDLQKNGWDVQ
jgi:predicted RNase H-like HicB family nuclease